MPNSPRNGSTNTLLTASSMSVEKTLPGCLGVPLVMTVIWPIDYISSPRHFAQLFLKRTRHSGTIQQSAMPIVSAVGAGGANQPSDVAAVQLYLNIARREESLPYRSRPCNPVYDRKWG